MLWGKIVEPRNEKCGEGRVGFVGAEWVPIWFGVDGG